MFDLKSIIFINTNTTGSSYGGIKVAKRLGFYIHLLKNRIENRDHFPEVDEIHAVNLNRMAEIEDTVLKICTSHHVSCIISFIDSQVYLAAGLSNQFCGTNLSVDSFMRMEDKLLTRKHLHNKDYSPWYLSIRTDELIKDFLHLVEDRNPIIVKSPKSCGSKDVFLITSKGKLRNRLQFLKNHYPKEDILVEEYLDGPQYIVEAIVYKGHIEIAAVIEQEITKKERFIVTGYSITPEIDLQVYNTLCEKSFEIIKDLGLENGNCHLELRLVDGQWKLIEANPRISGGVMNNLIKEAYGFDYTEQIVKVYLGMEPSIAKIQEESVYAHYLTVDTTGKLSRISGSDKAMNTAGVVDVYIKPQLGQILTPPMAMGQRCGYVMAKGKTKDEAKSIALKAARHIHFQLNPI
ncbi:ATP-grasp domain-containing protein [Metabacillus sp. KIGAM252]|uniref:ATP-grasp domain-containing protein n=1 Tax=Metabacillus flavus TaxID=2823519 RepID=A0ABS5LAV8_9BACI|nr:ATP-grasp domain-containing protein [Metabacillus flavus]MBS2967845.1 ATP-grasp domain-containing protein [Metabacillus flavus]